MKFTDLFVKRPVLAVVVNLVILIAGLQSIRALSVRQYPRSDIAVVRVSTAYIGAGADLVASCGLRVAAPDASFRLPGLRFGVVLGTRRLASRIGGDKARDILSASRTFDAREALALGFLTRTAARAEWEAIVSEARTRCELITPAAAAALHRQTVADTRAEDTAALARSVATPGLKERIRIFREQK